MFVRPLTISRRKYQFTHQNILKQRKVWKILVWSPLNRSQRAILSSALPSISSGVFQPTTSPSIIPHVNMRTWLPWRSSLVLSLSHQQRYFQHPKKHRARASFSCIGYQCVQSEQGAAAEGVVFLHELTWRFPRIPTDRSSPQLWEGKRSDDSASVGISRFCNSRMVARGTMLSRRWLS